MPAYGRGCEAPAPSDAKVADTVSGFQDVLARNRELSRELLERHLRLLGLLEELEKQPALSACPSSSSTCSPSAHAAARQRATSSGGARKSGGQPKPQAELVKNIFRQADRDGKGRLRRADFLWILQRSAAQGGVIALREDLLLPLLRASGMDGEMIDVDAFIDFIFGGQKKTTPADDAAPEESVESPIHKLDRATIAALRAEHTNLEARLEACIKEQAELEASTALEQRELRRMLAENERLQEEARRLKQDLTTADAQTQGLQMEVRALREENARLESVSRRGSKEDSESQQRLAKSHEAALEQLRQQLCQMAQTHQDDHRKHQENLLQMDMKAQTAEMQQTSLRSDLQMRDLELADLRQKVLTLQREKEELQASCAQLGQRAEEERRRREDVEQQLKLATSSAAAYAGYESLDDHPGEDTDCVVPGYTPVAQPAFSTLSSDEKLIGAEGGFVWSEDGNVLVSIYPNSVDQALVFSARRVGAALAEDMLQLEEIRSADFQLRSHVYDLKPHNTRFLEPIVVSVKISNHDSNDRPDLDDSLASLKLMRRRSLDTSWELVPCYMREDGHAVVELDSFCWLVLVAEQEVDFDSFAARDMGRSRRGDTSLGLSWF
eukprot:TRINITY_DN4193_c0_g1_i1.p1 TRINITY_DN4193_c0_g1~~TRINITY_DN4193_c0_g1_i1.p1  ORF type:complete len:612 (-),score=190.42 TRINITY_DN4193_c0_g1_i1:271-2106(-)